MVNSIQFWKLDNPALQGRECRRALYAKGGVARVLRACELHCSCGWPVVKAGEAGIMLTKCPKCGEENQPFKGADVVLFLAETLGVTEEVRQRLGIGIDWIEELCRAEDAAHQAFFGQTYDLNLFRQTLQAYGEAQVLKWQKLGLEINFLPLVILSPDLSLPGWKVKPCDWLWQQLAQGKLKRPQADGQLATVQEASLEGIVALIDPRLKPTYQDGKQMFAGDKGFLGPLIARLRKEGKLARYEYGPPTSRFGVSSIEWEEYLKPAVAELLGLEPNRVRLETAIEANVIPQLYPAMPRHRDGETDTWVWYEEYFEDASSRLFGGSAYYGGLAHVYWHFAACHWHDKAVRPLGVLAP